MDLNAFIRTADPRKVRIVERARDKNEEPIVTVSNHRTVTLLPTSVVRPFEELSASIEREFVGDASVGGGGDEEVTSVGSQDDVEPSMPIMENVGTEIPRPKRIKKKRVICGSERAPAASHPAKRLRANLMEPLGVPALPTSPFITSSVTASPLEEGEDHTDSVIGTSLRTIGPSASSAILYELRPPLFTTSSEKTDQTLSLFIGRSGSCFVAESIHAEEVTDAGLGEIYVPEWTMTKGFELNDGRLCANMIDHFTPPAFFKTVRGMDHEQLFTEFNMSTARNLSLSSEVRMRAEYNILEKIKMEEILAMRKYSLLGAKDKEIEELRSQLLKAKDEYANVAQLRARVSSLEAIEGSLQGEVASAKEHNGLIEQECGSLKLKVTSLESIIFEKDRKLSDLGASSSSLKSHN
ncbi:hypothetical protein Tco_0812208 [Tanacetum coccineum]